MLRSDLIGEGCILSSFVHRLSCRLYIVCAKQRFRVVSRLKFSKSHPASLYSKFFNVSLLIVSRNEVYHMFSPQSTYRPWGRVGCAVPSQRWCLRHYLWGAQKHFTRRWRWYQSIPVYKPPHFKLPATSPRPLPLLWPEITIQ